MWLSVGRCHLRLDKRRVQTIARYTEVLRVLGIVYIYIIYIYIYLCIYIIYTTAVHIRSLPGGFNPQNSSSFGGIIQGYPKMDGLY